MILIIAAYCIFKKYFCTDEDGDILEEAIRVCSETWVEEIPSNRPLEYAPGKYIAEQAARNYQPEAIPQCIPQAYTPGKYISQQAVRKYGTLLWTNKKQV